MGSAVERTDEHVREYLIYRGFTNTLRHLDSEIKADKEKGFRVGLCVKVCMLNLLCFTYLYSFSSIFLLIPLSTSPSIYYCYHTYYSC